MWAAGWCSFFILSWIEHAATLACVGSTLSSYTPDTHQHKPGHSQIHPVTPIIHPVTHNNTPETLSNTTQLNSGQPPGTFRHLRPGYAVEQSEARCGIWKNRLFIWFWFFISSSMIIGLMWSTISKQNHYINILKQQLQKYKHI